MKKILLIICLFSHWKVMAEAISFTIVEGNDELILNYSANEDLGKMGDLSLWYSLDIGQPFTGPLAGLKEGGLQVKGLKQSGILHWKFKESELSDYKGQVYLKLIFKAYPSWPDELPDGDFVYIPSGTFTMGNKDKKIVEEYPHRVFIPGFYLGRKEVTVANFMNDGGKPDRMGSFEWDGFKWKKNDNLSVSDGADGRKASPFHPVLHVSWQQAIDYCAAKTQKHKRGVVFDLPTEAQWEYAASYGGVHRFEWGNHQPTGKSIFSNSVPDGNVADVTASSKFSMMPTWKNYNDQAVYTTEAQNAGQGRTGFGTIGMTGNVWEWCKDNYIEYAYSNMSESRPMQNPLVEKAGNSIRVLRGGSWFNSMDDCRTANRFFAPEGYSSSTIGFRLVAYPKGKPNFSGIESFDRAMFLSDDSFDGMAKKANEEFGETWFASPSQAAILKGSGKKLFNQQENTLEDLIQRIGKNLLSVSRDSDFPKTGNSSVLGFLKFECINTAKELSDFGIKDEPKISKDLAIRCGELVKVKWDFKDEFRKTYTTLSKGGQDGFMEGEWQQEWNDVKKSQILKDLAKKYDSRFVITARYRFVASNKIIITYMAIVDVDVTKVDDQKYKIWDRAILGEVTYKVELSRDDVKF